MSYIKRHKRKELSHEHSSSHTHPHPHTYIPSHLSHLSHTLTSHLSHLSHTLTSHLSHLSHTLTLITHSEPDDVASVPSLHEWKDHRSRWLRWAWCPWESSPVLVYRSSFSHRCHSVSTLWRQGCSWRLGICPGTHSDASCTYVYEWVWPCIWVGVAMYMSGCGHGHVIIWCKCTKKHRQL